MTPSITLLSLACAIANGGNMDTSIVTAQLTQTEKAQVEQYIESGACLPERMESLLKETREKVNDGMLDVNGSMFSSAPSEICSMIGR